ncbi:ABC-type uncharacterized transport system substrate-binding protein [Bradyrhizobium sp. i1.3.1]
MIASEARPGGNVTGIEAYIAGLPTKQIELAREIVPKARRVGLLINMNDPKGPPQVGDLRAACGALSLSVVEADASTAQDIPNALAALANEGVDVTVVLQTNLLLNMSEQIGAIALEKLLPTVFGYREHVVHGGLVSYGVDLRWCAIVAPAISWTRSLGGHTRAIFPSNFQASFGWQSTSKRQRLSTWLYRQGSSPAPTK